MATRVFISLRTSIVAVCTALLALSGCTLFSTREPEDPITNRSAHQVPTSPDIVVQNFITAIREKNSANYTSCFTGDSTADNPTRYRFQPSVDAQSIYPSLFASWSAESEQRYFSSLLLDIAEASVPSIELTASASTTVEPSSSMYTFDYIFIPQEKTYRGKMRLTVVRLANGNWAIQEWIDEPLPAQQNDQTWSFLKATYGN